MHGEQGGKTAIVGPRIVSPELQNQEKDPHRRPNSQIAHPETCEGFRQKPQNFSILENPKPFFSRQSEEQRPLEKARLEAEEAERTV